MGICTKERKGDVSRILGAPGSSVKSSRPRRALPTSRPNYYLSRPAPTTHDANFQTTMYAANVQTLYIRPCLLYITPGPRA